MQLSPYDITLTVPETSMQIKLHLFRPEGARSGSRKAQPLPMEPQPLREGEQFYRQEQRATYADASGGAGYGERIAENVYHYGLPVDARMPGIILPPGQVTEMSMAGMSPAMTGPVYAFCEGYVSGGVHTYFVGNRYCVGMSNGTATPGVAHDFGSGFTGYSAVDWYGNMLVGGTGGPIFKMTGGSGAWGQSPDVYRQFLESVFWEREGEAKARLIGTTTPGGSEQWPDKSMKYADHEDPMSEALHWSEEIYVGNTGHSLTGLVASNRHVYYLKSNGLYDMDDRLYSPNLTEYRKRLTDVLNPMPVWLHNEKIYFGSRTGLDQVPLAREGVRQDEPKRCEFGYGLPNYGPVRGIPMAGMPSMHGGMWVSYWNEVTATSYLCWAQDWDEVEGVDAPPLRGPLRWHGAFAVFPGVCITALHEATPSGASYAPRLWLGGYDIVSTNTKLYWMSMPRAGTPYQDLLQGGPMRFATSMVIDFPRETFGSDVSRKDLTRVSIRGDNLGTATLRAYAVYDGATYGAGPYTPLGESSSAYEEFAIDDETSVRDMTFRIGGTGTSAVPPILRALEAQAGVSVEANTVHTYTCVYGGDDDSRDPFAIESVLGAVRGRRASITDHRRNRSYRGRVLQDVSSVWEELPSGERTGRVILTLPFLVNSGQWSLDEGFSLDSGLVLG